MIREFMDSISGIPYNVFDKRGVVILGGSCFIVSVITLVLGVIFE